MKIDPHLWEKISESLSSVLPITAIVLLLSVTAAPLSPGTLVLFFFGAMLLIVGTGLFTLGVDMSMMAMGEGIGVEMSLSKGFLPAAIVAFVLGALATVAEPDLQVLAGQVPAIPNLTLIVTVALGVGLCAGIKARDEELQDLVMTDVCPFSLGVATCNSIYDKTPHMSFLISRSSMPPAVHRDNFYTLWDNQRALRFEIYQGEGYFASENLKLGELEVQVPPGPAGEQYATVTFTYDIDGILHVSAKSSGGDYRERLILNPHLHLTPEEQRQALERIGQIQLAAQGSQQEQFLLDKALSLYQQSLGPWRDAIGGLIYYLQSLGDYSSTARRRAWAAAQERLEQIEAQLQADPLSGDGFWGDFDPYEDTEDEED